MNQCSCMKAGIFCTQPCITNLACLIPQDPPPFGKAWIYTPSLELLYIPKVKTLQVNWGHLPHLLKTSEQLI